MKPIYADEKAWMVLLVPAASALVAKGWLLPSDKDYFVGTASQFAVGLCFLLVQGVSLFKLLHTRHEEAQHAAAIAADKELHGGAE